MTRETAIYLVARAMRIAKRDYTQLTQAQIDAAIVTLINDETRIYQGYALVDVTTDNLSIH